MNYKKRDDELIKLNKQARAKANIGNNSGNVGYTENAFRSRKKLPELQNSPNKATTQANNLTDKGFSGSKSSNTIDFDYVLKNDKYWGNKGMSVGALDIDSDYRRKMGRTENAEDNAKYYQRFGMSRNEVLDQYDKYKRETHPIRTAFEEDFRSAPDRAVTGALGSLAHLAFPHSDLDKMANSDFVQRKNREVQRGRDYVQDSNKLTDTQKAIARGVESGGDFLTNMATAGVLGGGGAIADVASGVGTMIQPAKWVSPFLNGLFNYGSTSQEVKHDLERQGVDSDTAYNMGNASGAISGAAGALMMGTGGKAASTGANWLMKALAEGGRIGGISLGQQGLQEIANQLILDNQSTFNNDVQNYVAQGYSEEEAANHAAANVLGRVGSAGATGFLGGAGFSLLGSGLSKIANRVNQGVPSAGASAGSSYNGGFNEYAQPSNNRPLLTQVDALPDNGTPIPSIEGMMTLGLPKKQLPSDAIRMPGTQGVIHLPGQTKPINLPGEERLRLPEHDVEAERQTILEEIRKHKENELDASQHINMGKTPDYLSDFGDTTLDIGLRQKKFDDIISPKNDAEHLHGLTDGQVADFAYDKNAPLAVFRSSEVPNTPVIVGDRIDDNGAPIVSALNMDAVNTQKYIDKNLLRSLYGKDNIAYQLQEARDNNNMLFEHKDKVDKIISDKGLQSPPPNNLTNLSNFNVTPSTVNVNNKTSKIPLLKEMESQPVNTIKENQDKLNKLIESNKEGSVELPNGQIFEKYSQKYMKNILKEIKANGGMTDSEAVVIRYKDGSEAYYTGGDDTDSMKLTNIDSVIYENESTSAFSGSGIDILPDSNDPSEAYWHTDFNRPQRPSSDKLFDLDLQFFSQGKTPDNGYWLRLLGDKDFLAQEAVKNNTDVDTLRQYANYNLGYDGTTNNAPKQDIKPDNSYWTKVLSDDSFLQSEAQKHNVTPDVLRDYANMNLGNTTNNGGGKRRSFFNNNNMPGGNVPPNNNGGNNVPPNNGRPINLTQDSNGNVRESGTSRHIRGEDTAMKYNVSDEMVDDFTKNPGLYKQLKNKDTQALAEAIYNSGNSPVTINGRQYDGSPETKFRNLLAEKNPAALPLGAKIADDYSQQGNHKMAAQLYRDMESALTDAGQFTQAAVISMMKNNPLSALAYLEKEIDALNKNGADKYGKKWKDFVLTDDERKLFDNIKPGDTDAIRKAYDKIGARIEKEYPASTWEKVLEFRRVAMLFNSRTIMRNTLANVPTAGMRYVADRIEGVGQYVANLIDPSIEKTQAIRGSNRDTRKLAIEVFNSDKVQRMLKETPGRLSEVPQIGDYAKRKQMFKGGIVSKFINNMTNGGIEKLNAKLGKENADSALELMRNSAYAALEITDYPAVRENFISRLGSYMRVKGINSVNDVPDEAINIALEEALKATYKDNSWLVQGIKGLKGGIEKVGNGIMPGVRLGDMASQALIPYVQAPGNIGARVVDYSAIGGTKGIADIIRGANQGNADQIRKGIEEASKGLTGTLLLGLGVALYKSGLITGSESDDKDQRAFDKMNGFREFALRYTSPIDGKTKYDTIDWMQPFIDDVMPGVLLAQAIENSDQYDSDILRYFGHEGTVAGKAIGVARESARKNINYFFNATPLKNFGELFKSKYNGEQDIAGNLWENTVEDFGTGLIPSGVNSIAKTIDSTQRQITNPDNTFGTFLNSVGARLPFVSKMLPVKYDQWGEAMKYGDNMGEAAFAKMLYPGEHTSEKADAIDDEINRLFNETQEKSVFPQVAPNSVDGVKLTDKELSEYQRTMGLRNRKLAEVFINSDVYKNLSDTAKAETLTNLFNVSNAIAANEIKDKTIGDTYAKAATAYEKGGAEGLVSFYATKQALKDAGVGSGTNAAKEISQLYSEGKVKEAQKKTEQAVKDNNERVAYNEANGTDIGLADFQKKKAEGSINTSNLKVTTTKPATTKQTPTTVDVTNTNVTQEVMTKNQKFIDRAGKQSRKFTNDIPKLDELKFGEPERYTYAYAINQDSSLTPEKFDQQYDKMDLDKNGSMKQDEMITYFNNSNVSEKEGQYLWKTYGENKGNPWKTLPVLKNGTWKKTH